LEIIEIAAPFQADDEGSIPFTRSNDFNGLYDDRSVILNRVLLLILNPDQFLFAPRAAFQRPPRPVFWFAWRIAEAPWLTYAAPEPASVHRSNPRPQPR
jgi:hypothetical protein